jgi:iron complex transport system ATP-binding protein
VIATMHDLTLAAQYGDRIILLDGGRVVTEGAPEEVLSAERVETLYSATVRLVVEDGQLVAVVPLRRRASS